MPQSADPTPQYGVNSLTAPTQNRRNSLAAKPPLENKLLPKPNWVAQLKEKMLGIKEVTEKRQLFSFIKPLPGFGHILVDAVKKKVNFITGCATGFLTCNNIRNRRAVFDALRMQLYRQANLAHGLDYHIAVVLGLIALLFALLYYILNECFNITRAK